MPFWRGFLSWATTTLTTMENLASSLDQGGPLSEFSDVIWQKIHFKDTVYVLMIFCKIYFFAVTAALCAPLLLHIPRQQDHQRWGQNFFLSWAFFFSGKRWGQNFFLSWAFFSLCCDQVDDEGGNQVQKDKSNLFLGAGECISAQQSPIRHISRRGREGAGLLISWYFYYNEN